MLHTRVLHTAMGNAPMLDMLYRSMLNTPMLDSAILHASLWHLGHLLLVTGGSSGLIQIHARICCHRQSMLPLLSLSDHVLQLLLLLLQLM